MNNSYVYLWIFLVIFLSNNVFCITTGVGFGKIDKYTKILLMADTHCDALQVELAEEGIKDIGKLLSDLKKKDVSILYYFEVTKYDLKKITDKVENLIANGFEIPVTHVLDVPLLDAIKNNMNAENIKYSFFDLRSHEDLDCFRKSPFFANVPLRSPDWYLKQQFMSSKVDQARQIIESAAVPHTIKSYCYKIIDRVINKNDADPVKIACFSSLASNINLICKVVSQTYNNNLDCKEAQKETLIVVHAGTEHIHYLSGLLYQANMLSGREGDIFYNYNNSLDDMVESEVTNDVAVLIKPFLDEYPDK